jgi:hypothetical protein
MRRSFPRISRAGRLQRRGIFLLDALLGLFLVVAITAALGLVVSNQRRAAILTANGRDAVREAESGLTSLQAGRPAISRVAIKRIDAPAPAGWMWVEATDQSGGRGGALTALVPLTGGVR